LVTEGAHLVYEQGYSPSASIDIGPRTNLASYFNSVDFVWNTAGNRKAFLFSNASYEWFKSAACHSDSLITVPTPTSRREIVNSLHYIGIKVSKSSTYVISSLTNLIHVGPAVSFAVVDVLSLAGVNVGSFRDRVPDIF
jgi:hypothetical protein